MRIAAYHEASHAVVAWALGIGLRGVVCIQGDSDHGGGVTLSVFPIELVSPREWFACLTHIPYEFFLAGHYGSLLLAEQAGLSQADCWNFSQSDLQWLVWMLLARVLSPELAERICDSFHPHHSSEVNKDPAAWRVRWMRILTEPASSTEDDVGRVRMQLQPWDSEERLQAFRVGLQSLLRDLRTARQKVKRLVKLPGNQRAIKAVASALLSSPEHCLSTAYVEELISEAMRCR